MASLNKLAIRGIRSFDDKQISVIEFFSPVTVIVGHNGSGKTTIIECLKYATTGEQPPNTRGGAFIHDPVLANEREVKAQVKLRFNAANGTRMLAVRNLQVSKKKTGGLTMKTLENILSLADAGDHGGKRATISTKCAEIDEEIPHLLGVSKSVLENVIFCHQEDSYWPLAEPAALKKKFDDIFEATRYTKALDAIKNLRKERVADLKTEKERLESLAKEKGHADKLRGKINDLTSQISGKELQYEDVGSELQRQRLACQRFYDASLKFKEIYDRVRTLTEEIERLESLIKDTSENLAIISDPDEVLERRINSFNQERDNLSQKQKALRRQQLEQEELIASLNASLNDMKQERGKLQALADAHEESIGKREELVRRLSTKYKITGFDRTGLDRKAVLAFSEKLEDLQLQRQREVDALTKEGKAKKEEMDAAWKRLAEEEMKLKERRAALRDELNKLQSNISSSTRSLDQLSSSADALSALQAELQDKTARLARARREAESAAHDKKIAELAARAKEIDARREELQRESREMSRQSESRARLDLNRAESEKAQADIQALLRTNTVKYRRLVGNDPQAATMEREVDRIISEKDQEVAEAEAEYETANRRLGEIETMLATHRTQLATKQAEMKDMEKKLSSALVGDAAGGTIKAALENAQAELDQVKDEVTNQEAVLQVFEDIFNKSKNKKHCMVCNRGIDDMPNFEKYMKRQLEKNAKNASEGELREWEAEVARLKKLLPVEEQKDRLKKVDIPASEKQIKELEAKLPDIADDAEKKQETLSRAKRDQKEILSLKVHATSVSRSLKAIASAEDEIKILESQLSTGEPLRSAEVIEQEMQDLTDEWRSVENKRHSLSTERDRNQKEQQALLAQVHDAERRRDSLQRQVEDAKKLETDIEGYKTQVQQVKEQIKETDTRIAASDKPMREHQSTKVEWEKDFEERMQVAQGYAQELERSVSQLRTISDEIDKYIKGKGKLKLEENAEEMERVDGEIEQMKGALAELNGRLEEVAKEIGSGSGTLQTLQANVTLRKLRKEIAEKQETLASFDMEEAARARRQFEEQYPKEEAKMQELQSQHARLSGELGNMKENLAQLEKDMADFKEIHQQYRNQLVKVKMSDMANSDLEKYAKALDHAIMKYHSLKMEEVNDTMRHLWNKTYQGTDIDGIKICSDSEGATVAGRRSYNYRVVMTKDHVEMDMRGRCSAGQKMLASIIIRLALSDSFGQNCGILALDEPTNALDTENIDALAASLVDIINARKGNSNFQLIVITHDEQFLRKLGEAEVMEYYWRVSRDTKQKSVIERQRFG